MSFFNAKKKSFYTLSISLKSSLIDFQLIKHSKTNKEEVLFVDRHVIFLQNSQDSTIYINQYIKELTLLFEKRNSVIKELVRDNNLNIRFILYSPWFTSKIEVIKQVEPVILNENFLIKKLQEIKTDENLKNLEKRAVKIEADGYRLNNLMNRKLNNICLQIYSSYISKQTENIFTGIVQKYFPFNKSISYRTIPLLMFDQIRNFMIQEDNVTFMHIGGEITEIGIIKDDSLDYFSTFPLGIHDFLREIQSNVKTYDYNLLYQKEIQIKSEINKKQFNSLRKKWVDSLENTLGLFEDNVPNKILIVTDQKVNAFFTEILSESIKKNKDSLLTNQRIIHFDISLLKDIIAYKTPVGENEIDLKLEALI